MSIPCFTIWIYIEFPAKYIPGLKITKAKLKMTTPENVIDTTEMDYGIPPPLFGLKKKYLEASFDEMYLTHSRSS